MGILLQETHSITLMDSDPYLGYYIVRFDCRYNLSVLYTYEQMMKQVDSLATCNVEKEYDLLPNIILSEKHFQNQ